jgi:hypothetical protein
MVESPSKSSLNKVISGRVTKPARSNRAKVSYTESGDENEEEDEDDQMIESDNTSFAVQSGNGNGMSSFNNRIAETYGNDSFATHHGYEDEQFVDALEEDV